MDKSKSADNREALSSESNRKVKIARSGAEPVGFGSGNSADTSACDKAIEDEDHRNVATDSDGDEVGDEDTSSAAAQGSGIGSRDQNGYPYLHIYEHSSGYARLAFDARPTKPKLILYSNKKGTRAERDVHLRGKNGNTPITIKCYRFGEGRTLHIVNREATTMINRKTLQWKKCHVHLPEDKWLAGFVHKTAAGSERKWIGPHIPQYAEHNAIVFTGFMDELEKVLGQDKVQSCRKRRGEKIVLEDVVEGSSDGNHSDGADGEEDDTVEEHDELEAEREVELPEEVEWPEEAMKPESRARDE
ncbi:hypothetical protein G6011_06742 [Alternaria panax]|uniref:Uncharacterized protein n=1 Tax=Alternaria panax TaxID=48097 RepID=A0AAD4FLV2_9PLEO|nr:hypothetical protein G6011_06742 [Alternaria panax]